MQSKTEIRKAMHQKKKELSSEYEKRAEEACFKRVISLPEWKNAECILIYVSYNHEMGTELLIEEAFRLGKMVASPKVEGSVMNFYVYETKKELVKSKRGILEPVPNDKKIPDNALMIMPGVAFDKDRNRVGYGGGYYDKYSALHSYVKKIAIAYDFQILEHVPSDIYDIKPDRIITETRMIT